MQPIALTPNSSPASTVAAAGDLTALPLLHYPAQHRSPTLASDEKVEGDIALKMAEDLPTSAFADALLTVTNGLLKEAGQESRSSVVAAVVLSEKGDQKQRSTATARSEPTPDVQRMLDILLKAGQSAPLIDTLLPQTTVLKPEQIIGGSSAGARTPQLSVNKVTEGSLHLPLSLMAVSPAVAQLQAGQQEQSPTLSLQAQPLQPLSLQPPSLQALTVQPNGAQLLTETAGSSVSHTELKAELQSHDNSANLFNPSRTLKLEGGQERWLQQLQSALGERLQMQFKEQVQHATIRLDPPALGKIDISLQIENGRIQVHINASQGEVYRALNQVSNELRQSLTEQNFIQVNVQVSSQSGQQQKERQQENGDPEVILASEEITHGAQSQSLREDGSILLTV